MRENKIECVVSSVTENVFNIRVTDIVVLWLSSIP